MCDLEVWLVKVGALKIISLFGFFIAITVKYFAPFRTIKQYSEQFVNMLVNIVCGSDFFLI